MKRKLLSILLCLAMALSLLPTAALADETTGAGTIKVGNASYESFSGAVNAATPDDGVITYEISGKVDVTDIGWVQVAKADLTGFSKVEFIGITDNAEICITQGKAILADQNHDIDVSFKDLTLTKSNPQWTGDYGHSTNYFTCWLRNTGAAENTVTYTNCTFPNGVCNNQYGKTVFDDCKFTNATSGKFNLWNYGGNTEVKNSAFTGVRGIKTYNEGTLAVAPTVKIEQTTFSGLTEKAAIVVSKATDITLTNVTATGCTVGLLQKDIEGSTDEQKVTIEANGTGISGKFNITHQKDAEAAKNEFNISGGTFTSEVKQDYCEDGFEVKAGADGTCTVVESDYVAKVGDTGYDNLDEALAALNADNHTLTLIDGREWDATTPVYWEAGTQYDYAATLTDALTAAYKAGPSDEITIVCRPGADVGEMTHGHVADNITLYGNNAYLSGGECDLEVDTYKYDRTTGAQSSTGAFLSKDITITAYELDNLGVWGQRNTEHTVTVNLIDCDGREISDQSNNPQRVYISGTSGKNDITLTGCDFLTKATSVYSNADGVVMIDSCSFTGSQAPVNFNHKANGTQTVTVKNSKFENCGDAGDWKQFAAPIRFVNSGTGTMSANVDACTIIGTVGNNGDILIGDGRTNETSNNVILTVSGTAANVQAQKPGYYNGESTVDSKKAERQLTAADSLNTTIADLLPVTEVDLDEFIKLVTSAGYNFDGASVAGTGKKLTVEWSPVSGCFNFSGGHHQLGEDCPKTAATGNTPNRWQDPYAQYQLFASATDLSISNVNFVYVPAKVSVCMNGSWGGKDVTPTLAELQLNNSGDTSFAGCTFDKVTVSPYGKGNNNGNTNEQNIASFTGCEFANVTDKYAIKDVYAGNVTVKNCTFTNCGGGIYLEGNAKKGTIDISDNNFTKIGTKGLIQFSANGDYTNADIILDGNTATNCGPTLRQLNQGIADNDVLSKNLKGDLTGLGGELTFTDDSVKKKTDGDDPVQPTIYTVKFSGSDVADMKVASGTEITLPTAAKYGYTFKGWKLGTETKNANDKVTISADTTFTAVWQSNSSGSSGSYDPTYSVSTPSKTENGTVTVSPKSASKGDTVTITVDPDEGYELDELTVTDANGNEIELTRVSDTEYTFTMPRSRVTIEAAFVEINHADTCPSADFTDVDMDAWYHDAVDYAIDNGMMNGVGNNLFAPESNLTRAMLVQVLWNLEGNPEASAITEYSDVASDAWYYNAVQWATAENIVGGYGNGIYGPEDDITREQMALMLYRYAQYKGYDTTQNGADVQDFADYEDISDWALEGVTWAVNAGLLNGKGNGILDPIGDATRAEVAQILMNFCENIVE